MQLLFGRDNGNPIVHGVLNTSMGLLNRPNHQLNIVIIGGL